MRTAVLAEGDLEPGEMKAIRVGGLGIVVIRKSDGSYRALRDRCSHQGGALSAGRLEAMVEGERVGDYSLSSQRTVVRCPLHHFEFDVDNGMSPADPHRLRVRAYEVTVSEGRVYIER